MIAMWDGLFSELNSDMQASMDARDGYAVYRLMHEELNKTWKEVDRVLKQGGIACINIGDATRTVNGEFRLYPNHSPILETFLSLGFDVLPTILWKKTTNAPNKFMGSGMLPVGAYVTLEHERILIFRKGAKREFIGEEEKENRMRSAFFFSERNAWFSDVWDDITGTPQTLKENRLRERSAAYPFALPYRLINMFSVKGDVVLDPFLGTGTTTAAAIVAGRNSIGVEKEPEFSAIIDKTIAHYIDSAEQLLKKRVDAYVEFTRQREKNGKACTHTNEVYSFPVVTRQEKKICFEQPVEMVRNGKMGFVVKYRGFDYMRTSE